MIAETCGKGTTHGQCAAESPYGFAACTLPPDHRPPCDSGPSLTTESTP
jgi:hypothetical protein